MFIFSKKFKSAKLFQNPGAISPFFFERTKPNDLEQKKRTKTNDSYKF